MREGGKKKVTCVSTRDARSSEQGKERERETEREREGGREFEHIFIKLEERRREGNGE